MPHITLPPQYPQLDLATKIKNIELTFPETAMDPHLKHLLKQMLTKDYRTRYMRMY
jgi:hypothetical protein